MTNDFTLAERLRAAHVKRWNIVRVAREQTVAEHMFRVRSITLAFADAAGFNVDDRLLAEQWAMEHDIPEVKTGDLNTAVKAAFREAIPHEDPIRRIELAMSKPYADLYHKIKVESPHVRDLVKLADTAEAVFFLAIEGMGNHAKQIERKLWEHFHHDRRTAAANYPQYNWGALVDIATKTYHEQ